jgi:hypothetical protein
MVFDPALIVTKLKCVRCGAKRSACVALMTCRFCCALQAPLHRRHRAVWCGRKRMPSSWVGVRAASLTRARRRTGIMNLGAGIGFVQDRSQRLRFFVALQKPEVGFRTSKDGDVWLWRFKCVP